MLSIKMGITNGHKDGLHITSRTHSLSEIQLVQHHRVSERERERETHLRDPTFQFHDTNIAQCLILSLFIIIIILIFSIIFGLFIVKTYFPFLF